MYKKLLLLVGSFLFVSSAFAADLKGGYFVSGTPGVVYSIVYKPCIKVDAGSNCMQWDSPRLVVLSEASKPLAWTKNYNTKNSILLVSVTDNQKNVLPDSDAFRCAQNARTDGNALPTIKIFHIDGMPGKTLSCTVKF